VPPLLRERPEPLRADAMPFWDAFWRLARTRQWTMNGEPVGISYVEIHAFLLMVDFYDFDLFLRMIEACDEEYIEKMAQRSKDKREVAQANQQTKK
jgi:hypothetical protein